MASSLRRMSQAPSSHVNLHCLQCDSQIGIFDNEWSRLTTSYVRSIHPGANFGTEVAANRTQMVPEGTTQRVLQGCTLAEVFCTKCSAVVGQYCKAIPGPERRNMLKQYLYKLSKTYLKNGDTNERVDPIFGYVEDVVQTSVRTSATPRLSTPAVPRWSQTPLNRDETTSRFQIMPDSYRRISAPMTLQNYREPTPLARPVYEQDGEFAALQFAVPDPRPNLQEERFAALDTRMQVNEDQLRNISSILDVFQGTLADIQSSIEDVRSQNSTPHVETPTQVDFVASLHSMIMTMKTAQSNAQELEELRAENASLKAKWDIVQSAMATVTGTFVPSSSTMAHSNSLGKRKRDSAMNESTPAESSNPTSQPQSFWLGDATSVQQVPTPQSSTHSDLQSQDVSNTSRSTTPEAAPIEPDIQVSHNSNNSKAKATRASALPSSQQAAKKLRLSEPSQPTKISSPTPRFPLGDGSKPIDIPQTGASMVQQTELLSNSHSREASHPVEQDDECQASTPAESTIEIAGQEIQPHADENSTAHYDKSQSLGSSDEPQRNVNSIETVGNRLTLGESVEFSDDEGPPPPSSEGHTVEQAEAQDPQAAREGTAMDHEEEDSVQTRKTSTPDPPNTPDNASTQSAPAGRTRSKTKAASVSARRKTTSFEFVEEQGVAPEPQPARRILPHPLNLSQTGVFEHSTPETVEAEMIESEKPKGPRQHKTYKQTTVNILHDELRALGLEEWIHKDKTVPEYKMILDEARARKREQTKLVALASRGVTAPGANMDERSPLSPPSLDEALQQAQALADVTNEKAVAADVPAKTTVAARRAGGEGSGKTRRKSKAEREEEIRKRDELAKAAMEMDD